MQHSSTSSTGKGSARRRRLGLAGAGLATVAAAALAGPAAAFEPTETVMLLATKGSKVNGSVMVGAQGNGTSSAVTLSGLKPGATVSVLFKAGTCKKQSASFGTAGQGKADAKGTFTSAGSVLYRGAPVSFTVAGDGKHVLVALADGKPVACGAIPGMS